MIVRGVCRRGRAPSIIETKSRHDWQLGYYYDGDVNHCRHDIETLCGRTDKMHSGYVEGRQDSMLTAAAITLILFHKLCSHNKRVIQAA